MPPKAPEDVPYLWTFNSLGFPENKAGLKGETKEYYPGSHNGIGGSLETPKVTLTDWSYWRDFHKGFCADSTSKAPRAVISGLQAGATYEWKVYQYMDPKVGPHCNHTLHPAP